MLVPDQVKQEPALEPVPYLEHKLFHSQTRSHISQLGPYQFQLVEERLLAPLVPLGMLHLELPLLGMLHRLLGPLGMLRLELRRQLLGLSGMRCLELQKASQ